MFPCEVCGEQDFECADGFYFCTVCYTQSQHMRVEDTDEFFIPRGSAVKLRTLKTADDKETNVKDAGRPWMPHEAFLCIIKAQVEELIKKGADEKLKDVVFRLWVQYLRKTGVAFPAPSLNDATDIETKQSSDKGDNPDSRCDEAMSKPITTAEKVSFLRPRHREAFFGTVEKPRIRPRRFQRALKRTRAMSLKDSHDQMLKIEVKHELEGEQFYEGDDPLRDDVASTDDSSDETDSGDDYANNEHIKKLRVRVEKMRPEWMTMIKTACFSYLGLMYTNCLTMPSDIIRWIHQRTLPYFNVQKILDSDMMLSCFDQQMLSKHNAPKYEHFRLEAGRLAWFLNLSNFPEVPLPYLVQKYVHKLCLPAELNSLMKCFVKNSKIRLLYTPTESNHIVPNYEVIAVAHIIMVMKLLLGLDDHTEKELSKYATDLQKLTPQGEALFLWEEWLPAIEHHLYQRCILLPTSTRQVESIQDVEEFVKHYEHSFSFPEKPHTESNYYNQSLREQLQLPLTQLRDKYCLDNIRHSPRRGLSPFREESASQSDRRQHTTEDLLGQNVISSSDIKPDCSINSVANRLEETQTYGKCTGSLQEETNEEYNPDLMSTLDDAYYSDEPMHWLTDSPQRNTQHFSKVCHTDYKSDLAQHEGVNRPIDDDSMSRFRKTTIKYLTEGLDFSDNEKRAKTPEFSYIHSYGNQSDVDHGCNHQNEQEEIETMKTQVKACENYVLYQNRTVRTKQPISCHYSYKRLLNVCSNLIGCNSASLDLEVQRLQLVYIAESDKIKMSTGDKQRVMRLRANKYIV